MSQRQQVRQELLQQEEQTDTACKNRKRRNRKKRSGGHGLSAGAAGDSTPVVEKKLLQNTKVQLEIPQIPTIPNANRKAAGSNWEIVAKANQQGKQKASEQENGAAKVEESLSVVVPLSKSARHRQNRRAAEKRYVAMDCEMVGVGFNGQVDMLARVSIVSKRGEVLLDKFVKPQKAVTDYRTSISGIRPHDINNGEDFKSVQKEVVEMLKDKILIGHAISHDLAVLHIRHPQSSIRDTSHYKPLRRFVANGRTPSLKRLTQAVLGREIQTGEHNSVEDARAAMSIYNILSSDWEEYIKRHQQKIDK